jgi:O-glycosyl hydrolase/aryl-phospho-beta-D-glucosidase BglC (GH1 family)
MFKKLHLSLLLSVSLAATLGMNQRANAQTVSVVETTGTQSELLAKQPSVSFGTATGGTYTITITPSVTYQQMDGFGASFTDSSTYNVGKYLTSAQQTALMQSLFSSTSGIGLTMLRQPMGASDASAQGDFSYDDMPSGQTDVNLTNFSISKDLTYTIPVLKQAFAVNPNIKVEMLPWSPPAWMKTSGTMNGGNFNDTYMPSLAQYFVKTIEAYQAEGIPVYAIAVQNEPENSNGSYPTETFSASEAQTFIGSDLGPALANAGLSTKIFGYEHNWGDTTYPESLLADSASAKYIAGISWHCYSGVPSAQSTVEAAYPSFGVWFTECSGETSGAFSGDFGWGLENIIIGATRNWAKGVTEWNMALDENSGPTNGGCTNCYGFVTINTSVSPATVTPTTSYYLFGMANGVVPGAYRIESNSAAIAAGGIEDVAFQNPNGSITLIVYNDATSASTFDINWAPTNTNLVYTLPAASAATFYWSPTGASCTTVPSAPTNLTATASSSSAIGLTWTAVTPPANCTISSYSVYRSTTSGFTPGSGNLIASGVTGTTYSNTGLAGSTTYYYKVEAVDSDGTSAASAQASATTPAAPVCTTVPSAPAGLTATASSSSAIGLSWTAVTPPANCTISSYSVYGSTTSGFTPGSGNLLSSGVTGTTYSNTGLAASSTHYYKVEALDADGTSAASAQATATTQAAGSGLSMLHTSGRNIVNASGATVQLKGVALGGEFIMEAWMTPLDSGGDADTYTAMAELDSRFGVTEEQSLLHTFESSWITAADFTDIKNAGFNVVRIPVWWGQFYLLANTTPSGWRSDAFTALDSLVSEANAAGIYVIIDMHGVVGGQSTNQDTGQENQNQYWTNTTDQTETAYMWTQIATHYNGNGTVAGYDLLNEPDAAPSSAAVWAAESSLYTTVRAADPTHIAFIEGTWGNWDFDELPPPSTYGWTNVVYSMHEYQSAATTAAVETGSNDQVSDFNNHASWNVPDFIGEWNDYGTSTATWQYTEAAYNNAGINWTMWTYKSIHGIAPDSWGYYDPLSMTTPAIPNLETASSATIASDWALWTTANAFGNNTAIGLSGTCCTGTASGATALAPKGLTATVASGTQNNLSWTASSGSGITYSVYRSTSPAFTPTYGPNGTNGSTFSSNMVTSGLAGTTYSDTSLNTTTTAYYYVVEAVNGSGASIASNEASAGGNPNLPSPPTGLGATAISTSQINLSWAASTGPGTITYSVYRSTTSGFTPGSGNLVTSGLTPTTYSNTGLSSGTAYYYVVEGVNSYGSSGASNQANATTTAVAPSAPTNLTATAVSSGQINLSWTAPTTGGTVTYSVYRGTTSGFTPGSGNLVTSGLSGTTYSNTGLSASTTYYYVVEAVNSAGTSPASNQATAKTTAAGTISTTGYYQIVNEASAMCVDDTGGSTSNGTQLQQYTCAAIGTNLNQEWKFTATSGGYYEVTTYNSSTLSWDVVNLGTTPGTDMQLWTYGSGLNQQFLPALLSTGYYEFIDRNSGLCLNVPGGAATNNLQLQINTCNGATSESFTPNAISATAPAAPTALTATAASSSQINLSWTASTTSGVTYSVYRGTASGFTPGSSNLVTSGLSGTTYSNTGLSASTTYYYVVEAVNSNGTSPASNQASATTSATGGGISTTTYYQIVNEASGMCVDDTGGSTSNGTQLQQYTCYSGNTNQEWLFTATSGGYYEVTTYNSSTAAWNVVGLGTSPGTDMQLWAYGGGLNEQFEPVLLSTGYYKFIDRNSGLCLNVPGGAATNNLQLQINTCNGSTSESFTLNLL